MAPPAAAAGTHLPSAAPSLTGDSGFYSWLISSLPVVPKRELVASVNFWTTVLAPVCLLSTSVTCIRNSLS